jgi:translation elongation factor EF-1alpha
MEICQNAPRTSSESYQADNVGSNVEYFSVTDIKRGHETSDAKNVPAADTKFFKA